ncbi:hypothetical protein [Achromobacter sp. Root170]|uniref:hypothetical protein n=1 Tax=Achromobacter sp. Root170 TaxID=1736480 RepID=UPI0012E3E181|nr:hypothetical protein [Achromobacter sp. Root170]
MLANLKARPDWQALPDIRIAMWPQQVSFCDDISDERLFNGRGFDLVNLQGEVIG